VRKGVRVRGMYGRWDMVLFRGGHVVALCLFDHSFVEMLDMQLLKRRAAS
jgi:hypothetical protein